MNKNLRALGLVSILAVLGTSLCHGQIAPPVRKERGDIKIGTLHGLPRDRIIVVDLTVKQDGTVGDLDVVTGFYDDEYRAKALQALSNLRFQPATRDGAPVDFYGWRFVLATRRNLAMSADPAFHSEIEKIDRLTQSGDLPAAEAAIQDLINNKIVTVFEFAFLNEALVPIYFSQNRLYEALRASRLATLRTGHVEAEYFTGSRIRANDPNWPYLVPKDLLVKSLRRRFTIALSLERFAEANATYNELRTVEDLAGDDPIAVRARDLELRRQSPEPLAVRGKIEHGEWEFSPTRRLLSTKAAPGAVRSVDIKCRLHKESLGFDPDHDLLLPPPWGGCTLTFAGNDGADILVTEKMLPRPGF